VVVGPRASILPMRLPPAPTSALAGRNFVGGEPHDTVVSSLTVADAMPR
jgi:hypothetical protein